MSDILKQRLVGALILLALAVIFWPIVFVEPDEKMAAPRAIPEPPVISTAAIEPPDDAGLRASPEAHDDTQGMDSSVPQGDPEAGGSEEVIAVPELATAAAVAPVASSPPPAPAAPVARSEAPQRLAVDADGVPMAWTLQVATVSSAENAEALRRKLLIKHEKAYITTISSGGKQLYRVCVGPKFERQELERMQSSIDAEFGVKTMLVRYTP